MSVYDRGAFMERVNYAAQCLVRGTNSRTMDTCFEMGDGDLVVTALVRRSRRNPKLRASIAAGWGGDFPESWEETARENAEHTNVRALKEASQRKIAALYKRYGIE